MNTIKTKRLILRPFMLEDIDDFNEYARNPDIGPNAGWKPHENKEESLHILKEFIEKDEVWAIIEHKSMKVIGSVGLHPDKKRENTNTRNLGYVLNKQYWGKGYVTEASFAALEYAFNMLKLDLVSINHFPFNLKSKRVIEKLGFAVEGILRCSFKNYEGITYDSIMLFNDKGRVFQQYKFNLHWRYFKVYMSYFLCFSRFVSIIIIYENSQLP